MSTSLRSPGTPLGLFWQPLLDDYGRASNLMWRLADSVFFYVKKSMNVDHGIDAQRYSWLLHVAGIENDQKISARVDNAQAYFRDISIRYTTVRVNGTTMPALDRQNWFALMAWETQVTPDYAFRWWKALVDRLPLEDPQTKAPFPSPPPRRIFPEIGDPDLRPIAASFAALLSVVSPSGRDHERDPIDNAFIHPWLRSPTSSSVVASQRIMEALPGGPASVTGNGNASPGGLGGPPPLPPRPCQQPEASTSRPPPYSSPQRDSQHRRTWSPGTSPNDAPSISVTPKRHSTHVETFNDAFPEPDSFFGVESMQSIVNRGLGTPSRRPFSLSMMPVAAAEEARLRGELAEEALERPSAGRSTGWTILTPAGEEGEPSQSSDVEVKRRRRGSRIFSAFGKRQRAEHA